MFSFRRFTFLLLLLTIFTMPFMNSFMIPGLGSVNKILSIALVVVSFFTVICHRKIKRLPKIYYAMFMFLFWVSSSYFWIINIDGALLKIVMFIQLFLLSWIIFEFVEDKSDITKLFKAYIYGCFVVSFMTINAYLSTSIPNLESRFFLEEYNPNSLGNILSFGLPLSFYLILRGDKKFILYFPVALYMMFILSSRTVLISFVFIAISTTWMLFRYKIRFRKTIVLIALLVSAAVFNQIPKGNLERLSTVGEELSSGTLNKRTIIWEAGINVLKDRPLFGVGINNFGEAARIYLGPGGSAHNAFLSVAVETGIVGLLLFLIIILFVFYYSLQADVPSLMRWLSLTLFIIWFSISLVGHTEAQKFTWIVFSFIITMYKIDLKSNNLEKENKKVFKLPKVVL